MNISSTRPQLKPQQTPAATSSPTAQPESSSSSLAFDSVDAIIFAGDTFKGAVPLYGAYENFNTAFLSNIFGNGKGTAPAVAGVVSNLVGTAALGYGLATGTSHSSLAGIGLLVGSGVANAAARYIS